MASIKTLSKEIWVESHLAKMLMDILMAVNGGLSMAILAGGTTRFSFPSYKPLLDYVGGDIWIWSIWIGFSALFIIMPFRLANIIGLWLSMFWHIVWTSCFTVAVITYPTAVATPVVVYGGFALISASLLLSRAIMTPED